MGTTEYRAPELTGRGILTEKRHLLMSDVFSYGMTCIELITGEPPFADEIRPLVQLRIDKGDRPCLPLTVYMPTVSEILHRKLLEWNTEGSTFLFTNLPATLTCKEPDLESIGVQQCEICVQIQQPCWRKVSRWPW